MSELRQVFTTPDGKQFDTRAEALEYLRRPKILAALKPIVKGNDTLLNWLLDNREGVEMAFEVGTVRRVTKSERKQLAAALEAVVKANVPKSKFVVENSDAILESFRWPSVKRMDDAEKAVAAKNSLIALSNNEELADWVLANKDALLTAFEAGVEKRQISPKAAEGLAAYRAKKAAEKAAGEGTVS